MSFKGYFDFSGHHAGGDDQKDTIARAFSNVYDKADSEIAKTLKGARILFARYSYEDYSGDAQVIYRKQGKLYEVTASHCSCNGLEGDWDPSEVTAEALFMRPNRYGPEGYSSDQDAAAFSGWEAMIQFLKGERS